MTNWTPSIVIDVIKRRPLKVMGVFNQHSGRMAISTITLSELYHGAQKSAKVAQNLAVVEEFGSLLEVLPYTANLFRFNQNIAPEGRSRQSNLWLQAKSYYRRVEGNGCRGAGSVAQPTPCSKRMLMQSRKPLRMPGATSRYAKSCRLAFCGPAIVVFGNSSRQPCGRKRQNMASKNSASTPAKRRARMKAPCGHE